MRILRTNRVLLIDVLQTNAKVFFWLVLSYSLLFSFQGNSQTENYWSWNFNTPSVLLGGSVVAGNAGASAVFYNPSLILNDSIPKLAVSARIVSLQFFNADNIAGEGIDADRFIFKVQPRFLSYVFPGKNDRIGVEVSMFSPVSEDVTFLIQHSDELNLIERTAGDESYSGYLNYARKYEDFYIGGGLSYKISDKISVGASSFLSVKTMRYVFEQEAQAFQEGDSVNVGNTTIAKYIALDGFSEEIRYWNLALLFKLGAQYRSESDRIRFGMNLTLPSIAIYGEAKVRRNRQRSNVFNNASDLFTPNESTVDFNDNLDSTGKSPFSISVGAQYFTKEKKNFISVSAEYFHDVDSYSIISNPNRGNDSGQMNSLSDYFAYTFEAKAVTNVGIGFKQYISPSLFLLSGLRTDFSNIDADKPDFLIDDSTIGKIHLDKYHLSFGPVFQLKKTMVITGIQYTYGRKKETRQIVNYAQPSEYIPNLDIALAGVPQNNATIRLNEIALFLGVTLSL